MRRARLATALGWLAGIMLLATAGLHLTGLPLARDGAIEVSNPFFAALLVPLWSMPSGHWLLMACLAVLMAGQSEARARFVLAGLGAVLLLDAALMARAVGPFIGTLMIGSCGGLLLLSAVLSTRSARMGG